MRVLANPRATGRVLLAALFTVGILIVLPSRSLYAQGNVIAASLNGTVTDATRASVPHANVTLTSTDQKFVRNFDTTADGRYDFPLLPPGTYILRVEKSGFKTYNQSGIILGVGQAGTVDVSMQLGETRQAVTVTASAEIINTRDTNVSTGITSQQMQELPLDLRSPLGLVYLNSAANDAKLYQVVNGGALSGGNSDQNTSFFQVAGGRFGTVAFLLDGHWAGAGDWDGLMYAPAIDEIQEMKIQTNSFSAQYGWSMGGAVNMVTKSGTHDFHGDAYEFLRNSALDANLWYNDRYGIKKTSFDRNQFGISAGGPLYLPKLYEQRDKTFIFGLYEGRRFAYPGNLTTTIPTMPFRTGDFSALLGPQIGTDALGRPALEGQIYNPFTSRTVTAGQTDPVTGLIATQTGWMRDPFVGNVIPTGLMDPVALKMLPYWPKPTNSALVNNYAAVAASRFLTDQYTIRVDHNISNASRFFARWSQKRQFQDCSLPYYGATDPGGPQAGCPNNRWDVGLGYSRVFSPTLVATANFGWSRWAEGRTLDTGIFDVTTLGLPDFLNRPGVFPGVGISGIQGLGGGSTDTFPREVRSHSVDVSKIYHSHSLSMGFMWLAFNMRGRGSDVPYFGFGTDMTQGPNPETGNPATGYGFASFLVGAGDGGSDGISAQYWLAKSLFGWYVQDDWKVTPTITLNLGLRYDIQNAPNEHFNRIAGLDLGASNPLGQSVGLPLRGELVFTSATHRGVYNPQHDNFAPRIGLAWKASNKLSLRSGFGIFDMQAAETDPSRGLPLPGYAQTTPWVAQVPGSYTPVDLLNNAFPNGLIAPTGNTLGPLTNVGYNVDSIQYQNPRPTPYVEQWMVGLQYALTPNDVIEADYVGNHSVDLPFGSSDFQFNQLPDQEINLGNALLDPVPNPFYGRITSSQCGLDQPTVTRGQLLRPYPQYCGVFSDQQIGAFSTYNALMVTFNHRWSKGLQTLVSYTASKWLGDTSGNESWATAGSDSYQDFNNMAREKSLDGNDIPQSLVVSYVYELPVGSQRHFGSNLSKPANAVLGGWQVSGINTLKKGFPLAYYLTTNTTQSYGGGQRPNVTGNTMAQHPTIDQWLNPAAFSQPAPFTFGNESRYDPRARAPGLNTWDLVASKWFNFRENIKAQLRVEFYNLPNHPSFYAPNATFGTPSFGSITNAYPPRNMQVALKVYW